MIAGTYDSMRMLFDVDVQPTDIISTNVAQDAGVSQWFTTSTYTPGDQVYLTENQSIYQAIARSTGLPPNDPDSVNFWSYIRPTNQFAALDRRISTRTTNAGAIRYELSPRGYVTAVVFDQIFGRAVQVTANDSTGAEIYDSGEIATRTYTTPPTSIAEMLTGEATYDRQAMVTLPNPIGPPNTLVVRVLSAFGSSSVARILPIVSQVTLGESGRETATGLRSASRTDYNDFGEIDVVRRVVQDQTRFVFQVPAAEAGRVKNQIRARMDIPTLYAALNDDLRFGEMVYGIADLPLFNLAEPFTQMTMTVRGA